MRKTIVKHKCKCCITVYEIMAAPPVFILHVTRVAKFLEYSKLEAFHRFLM